MSSRDKEPLLRGSDSSSYAGQRRPVHSLRALWCPVILLISLAAAGTGCAMLLLASPQHNATPAQQQMLAETIQQLTLKQEAMMQALEAHDAEAHAADARAAEAQASTVKTLANSISSITSKQDSKEAPAAAPAAEEPAGNKADAEEEVPAAFAALPALTTLHNEVLRASHNYEQHRQIMRDTLQQLVHLEPAAARDLVSSKLKAKADNAMSLFTYRLYKLLLSTDKLIPCREDSTLVLNDPALADAAAAAQGAHPKYYFATNLRDNSVNMPQYTLSLLQTLLRLPQDSAFVSAYESNSDDGAHGWVDVLQLALNVIGTPSRLVTRGMLVRVGETHRIEHLARVRNMALGPLYQHYAAERDTPISSSSHSGDADDGSEEDSSSSGFTHSSGDAHSQHSRHGHNHGRHSYSHGRQLQTTVQLEAVASDKDAANLPPGVLPWDPDYILFVNDIFFCWSQVMRLLNYKADMTCGMDFWQNRDATVALPQNLKNKSGKPKPDIPDEYELERPIDNPMAQDQSNPIVFYDIWVSRDLSGKKFWWTHPFVHDEGTSQAAASGLPFRASCCWNGLAVLKAAPFKAGLRIRHAFSNECQASECTLVCDDFARLGYTNVVVDAGVQVSYDWHLAREMSALGIEGVGQSTWAQAKAAGIAGRERKPNYQNMECCDLKSKWVNFYRDCHSSNIMANNFTHAVLHGGKTS